MESNLFEKFSHPMMYVNDLGRAVSWYTDMLGFEARFVAPNAYASLHHPKLNMRLDLHPSEASSKDVGFGPIPYFLTADLDASVETLKQKGVKVGTPKSEGSDHRFVSFWDSEGNTLGLEQIVAR
jgi:predicted enzyme related to lactoylglutathione lyase